jgi:hypothetical protein
MGWVRLREKGNVSQKDEVNASKARRTLGVRHSSTKAAWHIYDAEDIQRNEQ